jgi:phospholipase/carboxylesterase
MTSADILLTGPAFAPLSGHKPEKLVVFLHGLGADGQDLIGLAPVFAKELPDAQFVSPNAPYPCDMAPYGHQWFSLQDRAYPAMLAGVAAAAPPLNRFIDRQLELLELTDADLALVGFSQGTMMALYTALRRPNNCAAIVGFSGALIAPDLLAEELVSSVPVCLIHGDADPVVPFAAMQAAIAGLTAAKVPVESHTRPHLGHGIDPEGIRIAAEFLKKHLSR